MKASVSAASGRGLERLDGLALFSRQLRSKHYRGAPAEPLRAFTRTNVAFISDNVFIVPEADFWLPAASGEARLTNIVKPITVANVCNRKELSAH